VHGGSSGHFAVRGEGIGLVAKIAVKQPAHKSNRTMLKAGSGGDPKGDPGWGKKSPEETGLGFVRNQR